MVLKIQTNLYGDSIYLKPGKAKFAIGNHVRISKYKRQVFDKGYTPNWTEEIFVLDKVLPTKPITYSFVGKTLLITNISSVQFGV